MGEVGGAVERIDYPSMLVAAIFVAPGAGAGFLAQHGVIGKTAPNHADHCGLGFPVGFGDEVDRVGLVADAGLEQARQMDFAGGPRRPHRDCLDIVRHRITSRDYHRGCSESEIPSASLPISSRARALENGWLTPARTSR